MKEKNKNLTAEQKLVLFDEGTEPPGSSELNNEKREGSYHCVNCDVKLFESLTNVFDTKTDNHLGYIRTEYHCKSCGSHHGHIFDDGPHPNGKPIFLILFLSKVLFFISFI